MSRFREEGIEPEDPDTDNPNGHAQEETGATAVPATDEEPATPASETATAVTAQEDVATAPATPVAADAPRIPRSQSADRTRTALSRAFAPSSASESSRADTTGDDESASASPAARATRRKVSVADFEMLRVLGKGCAGKVLLVRHRLRGELYALKAITKRHVLAHQELQHTLTEQAVLRRMANGNADPFVVRLHWSFHDRENLFLVMDFHPGGDLATQLARWGRLGRDRARFYAAEIVEGVEGLHAAGVVYRDLKPENILIAHDGHIVLTDFGLSKEAQDDFARATGTDTTSTFCGTAEYLAPEVIQGLPYSYEVDWWSFGTMLYEMLTGITPFWADNHSDMYVRVLQDELVFPDDRAMDQDTKSMIRGLLQRNPALRIKEPRIKRHPYFSMIDWSHVYYKRYIPPYIPPIDPSNASDTQNFDDTFLDMEPVINDGAEEDETDVDASGRCLAVLSPPSIR
ncbi:kinase-like domain-containing protein [Vararia minispora EC-137]|uniref:Kinase-like domain-containing protein n=1 Tax=Vararia minispora EC-137 TaxID=1314806 RepID=A0ACB8QG19_9AGAM|nr:kinase-like domain-containing protein [Vararia minispora EC-137]